jgi:phenylalanine-4-hydroxylase
MSAHRISRPPTLATHPDPERFMIDLTKTRPRTEAARIQDLTSGRAAFIEGAQAAHDLYIHQPYELYSTENHETWRILFERIGERWERYANRRFLEGVNGLCLPADRVPRLEDVNRFLAPRTGFRARAVSGYIPAAQFFECLSSREFPTTITIRDGARLDYLPEPDIFHDIAGHVPMHTDPAFADVLVRFGACARRASELIGAHSDESDRVRRLAQILTALARFFWFTIEFGLMRQGNGRSLKAYGSGLLSSYAEMAHAIDHPGVERRPIDLARVMNQPFEYDHFQRVLFIVESFDHLFELVGDLETLLESGRLDRVAPGGPTINEVDIRSFLASTREPHRA